MNQSCIFFRPEKKPMTKLIVSNIKYHKIQRQRNIEHKHMIKKWHSQRKREKEVLLQVAVARYRSTVFRLSRVGSSKKGRGNMGWIPCSGNSGTKKKIVKMEVQDSVAPQIKPTQGIFVFFCWFNCLSMGLWLWDEVTNPIENNWVFSDFVMSLRNLSTCLIWGKKMYDFFRWNLMWLMTAIFFSDWPN